MHLDPIFNLNAEKRVENETQNVFDEPRGGLISRKRSWVIDIISQSEVTKEETRNKIVQSLC